MKNIINKKYNQNIKALSKYERFDFCINKINFSKKKILDLGCGKGQLYLALKKKYKEFNYTGIDFDERLIKEAKSYFPETVFLKKNFIKYKDKNKYDIIVMWGFLSIFDNYKKILRKVISLNKKKGMISIFSGFNDNDFNTYIRYQKKDGKKIQSLNIFSIKTIEDFFRKKKYKIILKKKIRNK